MQHPRNVQSPPRHRLTDKPYFGADRLELSVNYPRNAAAFTDLLSVGEKSARSEEHTSELQSQSNLVCRLLLEKKKRTDNRNLPNSSFYRCSWLGCRRPIKANPYRPSTHCLPSVCLDLTPEIAHSQLCDTQITA